MAESRLCEGRQVAHAAWPTASPGDYPSRIELPVLHLGRAHLETVEKRTRYVYTSRLSLSKVYGCRSVKGAQDGAGEPRPTVHKYHPHTGHGRRAAGQLRPSRHTH